MSLNYFDSTSVRDNTNATSTLNLTTIVSTVQSAYPGDTYFDSTNEIGIVKVYYTHENGRQKKRLYHSVDSRQALVSWSSFAKDGTWQKTSLKVYDKEGAMVILNRANIGTSEDLYHDSTLGITYLNNS